MSLTEDVLRYSGLWGPSGSEDLVITAFRNDLKQLGLEPHTDALGNVTATVTEPEAGWPTVMISAHLDEVGFVVRKIEPDGFLRLHRVGGTNDRVVAGQNLLFRTAKGMVRGAVGVKSKHASTAAELASAVLIDDAYVDVMLDSREAVLEAGITVGTFGTFQGDAYTTGRMVRGKALDNRAGVAILLATVRNLLEKPVRAGVVVLGSVQEEFSVRGAMPAARRLNPSFGFCVDIAIATDTPDLKDSGDITLGGGPVLTHFTRAMLNGIIPNPKLLQYVQDTATAAGIQVQHGVLQGGLTDGSFMQYENEGIPIMDVSFPVRYTHTPVETASISDLEQTVQLLVAALREMPEGLDLSRGED